MAIVDAVFSRAVWSVTPASDSAGWVSPLELIAYGAMAVKSLWLLLVSVPIGLRSAAMFVPVMKPERAPSYEKGVKLELTPVAGERVDDGQRRTGDVHRSAS